MCTWSCCTAFGLGDGGVVFVDCVVVAEADIQQFGQHIEAVDGPPDGIGQVAGMVIVMVGLLVDGKMTRFAKARPGWEDWAANNIFFFGAMVCSGPSSCVLPGGSRPGSAVVPPCSRAGAASS